MLNLAVDLSEMGRRGEAEPLLRDAVAIWSATLGADHPTTARGQYHLAKLLLAAAKPEDALPYAQSALRSHEAMLSQEHSWRKDSARTCADALGALGRHTEAAGLLQRYHGSEESGGGPGPHSPSWGIYRHPALAIAQQPSPGMTK